jgi:hypothetical protein
MQPFSTYTVVFPPTSIRARRCPAAKGLSKADSWHVAHVGKVTEALRKGVDRFYACGGVVADPTAARAVHVGVRRNGFTCSEENACVRWKFEDSPAKNVKVRLVVARYIGRAIGCYIYWLLLYILVAAIYIGCCYTSGILFQLREWIREYSKPFRSCTCCVSVDFASAGCPKEVLNSNSKGSPRHVDEP